MAFYISRQRYYEQDQLVVEIACGGIKKAGKDILTKKFDGEQKNLVDPRDAHSIAAKIIPKWDATYSDEKKLIALVNADGKGSVKYYDPSNSRDMEKFKKWSEDTFSSMKKCSSCQKGMGNRDPFAIDDIPNKNFCSEYCIAKKYRELFGIEISKITNSADKQLKVKI